MPAFIREIRGIEEETLRGYLIHLGGESRQDGSIVGPGWEAHLTRLPAYQLGKAVFCCFQVEWMGESEAVNSILRQFDLRVMRPGG